MSELVKQKNNLLSETDIELKNILNNELTNVWFKNTETFIAKWLVHIATNAMKPDPKWNLHEDFETKLKAIKEINSIINPKKKEPLINIWFFNPPSVDEKIIY